MKILVVGGGAREHALCWKLVQSPRVTELLCTPGNPGTGQFARNLPFKVNDIAGIAAAVQELEIDFVVVGPEEPLSLGLADVLTDLGVPVFGPDRAAARIETSKQWAKEIMAAVGVPTARHRHQRSRKALSTAESFGEPVVIKADGLAAGTSRGRGHRLGSEAALRSFMILGSWGRPASCAWWRSSWQGTELSCLRCAMARPLAFVSAACDYKRVDAGDMGPNTGGMGAYALTARDARAPREMMRGIIEPTAKAMADAGSPMSGFLCRGDADRRRPKVLEFNCRFGDPETQVMLPLLQGDLVDLLYRTATGISCSVEEIAIHSGATVGVALARSRLSGNLRNPNRFTGYR